MYLSAAREKDGRTKRQARSSSSHDMRLNTLVAIIALLFICHTLDAIWNYRELRDLNSLYPPPKHIPQRIWQTWLKPVDSLRDDDKESRLQEFVSTWTQMNPRYRYELITDDAAFEYVEDTFGDRPDIISTFSRVQDPIIRADLLRYLVLYGDGGIYTDMDTLCTRPIDTWIPELYKGTTGLVIGIEMDLGAADYDAQVFHNNLHKYQTALCQWTLMASPRHPVMRHVIDSVIAALSVHAESAFVPLVNGNDVLNLTGPMIFTRAVYEALTDLVGSPITRANVTGLEEPKLLGDTLILPISAFGSGQAHSKSKPIGNDEQLLHHHFRGTWTKARGLAEK